MLSIVYYEDTPCKNILMQVNDAKYALHKLGHIILRGMLISVKDAIKKRE